MSMTSLDGIKASLGDMLKGIERYNPDNIITLERYVDMQAKENGYDLEANLALLKLYQFNPHNLSMPYVEKVLLKSLTNLPHSDFSLCKSLLTIDVLEGDPTIKSIIYLADLLETCMFKEFWVKLRSPGVPELVRSIAGFEDSIRKVIYFLFLQNILKKSKSQILLK